MKRQARQLRQLVRSGDTPVYSATFIFRIKEYDEDFDRLNELIDRAAESNAGFLGKERWENSEENRKAVVYYWKGMEALEEFSRNPDHRKAKQRYKEWYSGYEIIISELKQFRSDGGLEEHHDNN